MQKKSFLFFKYILKVTFMTFMWGKGPQIIIYRLALSLAIKYVLQGCRGFYFFIFIINSTDQPTTIKNKTFIRKKKEKKDANCKNIFYKRYNLLFSNNE